MRLNWNSTWNDLIGEAAKIGNCIADFAEKLAIAVGAALIAVAGGMAIWEVVA